MCDSPHRRRGVELLGLIEKPTARESAVVERFKTEGGPGIREFCPHLTKDDCRRWGDLEINEIWGF